MASKSDLEQLFHEADKDRSGNLTLQELISAMRRFGYKGDDKVLKSFFSKADASGDNKVSFEEYMKAMNNVPAQIQRAALMRRIFSKFDVDGNGTLNCKELRRATAILGETFSEEEIALLMEVLDKDNSGAIDMEEFIQTFMNAKR